MSKLWIRQPSESTSLPTEVTVKVHFTGDLINSTHHFDYRLMNMQYLFNSLIQLNESAITVALYRTYSSYIIIVFVQVV